MSQFFGTQEYEIAIPSYQRHETLRDKTLEYLKRTDIDMQRITVFVASEAERLVYESTLEPDTYGQIIVGETGMRSIRNFIQMFYAEKTNVFNLDDDLKSIYERVNDKKKVPLLKLDSVVQEGFHFCESFKCGLWGIYPVCNQFFMKERVTFDLRYIVGAVWGTVNTHDTKLSVTLDDKEDFERTLKFYIRDGRVVRMENYAPDTNYYGEAGGMQVERTEKRVTESAHILLKRYPNLCSLNTRKVGHTEIKLKDRRRK